MAKLDKCEVGVPAEWMTEDGMVRVMQRVIEFDYKSSRNTKPEIKTTADKYVDTGKRVTVEEWRQKAGAKRKRIVSLLANILVKHVERELEEERLAKKLEAAEASPAEQVVQQEEEPPMLVGSKEAARLLGVSVPVLRRLNKQGKMPAAIKLGRAYRWRLDELQQWVTAGCPER